MIDKLAYGFITRHDSQRTNGIRFDNVLDFWREHNISFEDRDNTKESGNFLFPISHPSFLFKYDHKNSHNYLHKIYMNPSRYNSFQEFLNAVEFLGLPMVLCFGWVNRIDYNVDVEADTNSIIASIDIPYYRVTHRHTKRSRGSIEHFVFGSTKPLVVYNQAAKLKRRGLDTVEPLTRIEMRYTGKGAVPDGLSEMDSIEGLLDHARRIYNDNFFPFKNISIDTLQIPELVPPELTTGQTITVDTQLEVYYYAKQVEAHASLDTLLSLMSYGEIKQKLLDRDASIPLRTLFNQIERVPRFDIHSLLKEELREYFGASITRRANLPPPSEQPSE